MEPILPIMKTHYSQKPLFATAKDMVFDVQYNCEFFILNPISRFWCPAKSCSEDTKGPGTTLAIFFFRIFLDLPAYN
jgi:hypothetical protein